MPREGDLVAVRSEAHQPRRGLRRASGHGHHRPIDARDRRGDSGAAMSGDGARRGLRCRLCCSAWGVGARPRGQRPHAAGHANCLARELNLGRGRHPPLLPARPCAVGHVVADELGQPRPTPSGRAKPGCARKMSGKAAGGRGSCQWQRVQLLDPFLPQEGKPGAAAVAWLGHEGEFRSTRRNCSCPLIDRIRQVGYPCALAKALTRPQRWTCRWHEFTIGGLLWTPSGRNRIQVLIGRSEPSALPGSV